MHWLCAEASEAGVLAAELLDAVDRTSLLAVLDMGCTPLGL